jgi:hypothetical protein
MNAAYGGVAGSNKIFLCLSANHKTVKNIQANNTFYLLRLFTTSANSCNHWVSVSPHLYLSAVWGDFSQDFTPNSPQALAQHRRPHGGAFLCPGSPANLCIGFRYSVPKSSKAA